MTMDSAAQGPTGGRVLVLQQITGLLSNDFTIEDQHGEPVAQVHTRGSGLSRFFLGSRRFEITDLQDRLLFQVQDTVTFGRDRFQITDADGQSLAQIVQRITFFRKEVDVSVVDGTTLRLRGDLFGFDFEILAEERRVATVSRKWSGLGRALLGRSTYALELDPEMPETIRYATLGSVIALDLIRAKANRRRSD
ncbi:LURP-one-related/scramblase family protein [Citricoccus sp. GCM10030269]|uniref:LURP-one-related/scramblase family protein n=1 Tax=Citricoccus sp. GCM10030269 TaxID=3273388 RepID=UPI003623FD26